MKKLIQIILVLTTLSSQSNALSQSVDSEMEKGVNGLVSLLRDIDAVEFKTERLLKPFSLPVATGVIAIFTIGNFSGGNNWVQYMAVFVDLNKSGTEIKDKHYSLIDFMLVGGKSWRKSKSVDVTYQKTSPKLRITLQAMDNDTNEGVNVFSIPTTVAYDIQPAAGHRILKVSEKKTWKGKSQPLYHTE